MNIRRQMTFFHVAVLVLLILLTACAGATTQEEAEAPPTFAPPTATEALLDTPTSPPTDTPMPAPTDTIEPLPTEKPAPTSTPEPPTPTPLPETGEAINPDWQVEEIDTGIKPALALDTQDRPHIVYMIESEHGYVRYALLSDGVWEHHEVADGYYYGPPAIAVSNNDVPHMVWHDHQDLLGFLPDKGDAVRATSPGEGEWTVGAIKSEGHDGWDNSIVLDDEDTVHTASIDPSQFDSEVGVEYAVRLGSWEVEEIGSGPIKYEFGTAIDVDDQNMPGISYYDDVAGVLKFARRDQDGVWTIETVDDSGEAGKFSSLAFDSQGRPHISYFAEESETSGTVRYAAWDGTAWQIEDVDVVDDVKQGSIGARHLTWLRLDSQDRPHVAYNDLSVLKYANKDNEGWQIEVVAESGDNPFGQLVVMDLDSEDRPHLVYSVFTIPIIPEGVVKYAMRQ